MQQLLQAEESRVRCFPTAREVKPWQQPGLHLKGNSTTLARRGVFTGLAEYYSMSPSG